MNSQLTYDAYGDANNPALILIHPFPFRAQFWSALAPQIAEAGYFVVAPNLRGCATSPLGNEAPSMNVLAGDVWSLADSINLRNPIVMGVSLGGYVTLAMARTRSEHLAGIGLIDTKASADSPAAIRNRQRIAREIQYDLTPVQYAEQMLPTLLSPYTHEHRPNVVAQVREWISASNAESIAWLQEAMASRVDSSEVLAQFEKPVLLVRGVDDVVSKPEDFQHMQDLCDVATFFEIPTCGHLPPIEDPEATGQAILSWLTSTS